MSIYKSKYITLNSLDSKNGSNPLSLISRFGNQNFKLYSGFTFSQISFVNNFYNVTSKKNCLKLSIQTNLTNPNTYEALTIFIEPGYYFIDDLLYVIKQKILNHNALYSFVSLDIAPLYDNKIYTTRIKITPYEVDTTSTLSNLLGFIKASWYTISDNVLKNGYNFASNEHSLLYQNQVAYLHSTKLKSGNSLNGYGDPSSVVAVVPVDSDIGSSVYYIDQDAANVHHLFSTKREITEIDFELRDKENNIFECSNNHFVIVIRLFQ
jgi:hypothetical protein